MAPKFTGGLPLVVLMVPNKNLLKLTGPINSKEMEIIFFASLLTKNQSGQLPQESTLQKRVKNIRYFINAENRSSNITSIFMMQFLVGHVI